MRYITERILKGRIEQELENIKSLKDKCEGLIYLSGEIFDEGVENEKYQNVVLLYNSLSRAEGLVALYRGVIPDSELEDELNKLEEDIKYVGDKIISLLAQ